MKKCSTVVVGVLLASLWTAPSAAAELSFTDERAWTDTDTAYQAAYFIVHAIDWRQTRSTVGDPKFYERNPLLGDRPSKSRVDNYFLLTAVLHVAISYALPSPYRRAWQASTIALEAYVIGRNRGVGVRVDF